MTKAILGALLLTLGSFTSAYAQPMPAESADARGLVGGKLRLNFATLGGDDVPNDGVGSRTTFGIGGFGKLNIAPMFAIQGELAYTVKGASFDAPAPNPDGTASVAYLELAALGAFRVPAGTVEINPYAGLTAALLLSAEISQGNTTVDVKDGTQDFELGLAFGVGAAIPAGPGRVVVDLRYSLGLTTIDDGSNNGSDADVENRVISLLAGYAVPI